MDLKNCKLLRVITGKKKVAIILSIPTAEVNENLQNLQDLTKQEVEVSLSKKQ